MADAQHRPRVAFIGNCQAQSLESLSSYLGLPIEVVSLPPVFDIGAFGHEQTLEKIRSCEYVFNQRVSEDYAIEFARPSWLREQFGSRAVSWPNVYFDGYFPCIEYLYSETGKIMGPLSDYHFNFVRAAWAHGIAIEELVRSFSEGALAASFRILADRSLYELRLREAGLTVRMSDLIAARWRYSKILFTMNHPGNALLFELLRRLLKAAGVAVPMRPELLTSYPYTLDEILIPAFPDLHRAHNLGFELEPSIKGKMLDFADGSFVVMQEAQVYDWPSLFQAFYRVYDTVCVHSDSTARIIRAVGQPLR